MAPVPLPFLPSCPQICSLAQPCYYTAGSLGVLVVTYLALFLLASNLIMPGGLFMCVLCQHSSSELVVFGLRACLACLAALPCHARCACAAPARHLCPP